MGIGDSLLACGDARKLHAGRDEVLIAIGNPEKSKVDWQSVHNGVPFLATQDDVDKGVRPIEWVRSFPSNRPYIDYDQMASYMADAGRPDIARRKLASMIGGYIWKKGYRATPAVIHFTSAELELIHTLKRGPRYVAIEPHIKRRAPINKQWSVPRMERVAIDLSQDILVRQISAPDQPDTVQGAERITPQSFREAMCWIAAASLYIGPEGALHHTCAALDVPAIVLFGGYISPKITGYDGHINLTGNAKSACGTKTTSCPHCREAMASITVEEVIEHARNSLDTVRVG